MNLPLEEGLMQSSASKELCSVTGIYPAGLILGSKRIGVCRRSSGVHSARTQGGRQVMIAKATHVLSTGGVRASRALVIECRRHRYSQPDRVEPGTGFSRKELFVRFYYIRIYPLRRNCMSLRLTLLSFELTMNTDICVSRCENSMNTPRSSIVMT
jgi:hypothetical protein